MSKIHEKISTKELRDFANKLFKADYTSHEEFFNIFFLLALKERNNDESFGKIQLASLLKEYSDVICQCQEVSKKISKLCASFNKRGIV